jgi:ATP-dependent helicase/nuclease subunit A
MHEQLDLFAPVSADSPGAAAAQIPPDQAARTLVAEALDTTLFVEAGAGSGKTTALVARVVNLVRSGVPIGSIAAITFTEKAAAELRHRTRDSLQHHRLGAATAPEQTLLDAALIDLDHAPIGTLHAFARRLLGEFPLESQLPPRFDVLDEVQSATAFHDRFTDLLEALLDDPQSVRLVELCEYDRFSVERGVRQMADDFQSNWDLVEERVGAHPPPRAEPDLDDIVARCAVIAEVDVPPGDTQEKTVAVIRSASTMIAAAPGLTDVLHALEQLAGLKGSGGNKQNWKRHGAPGEALPKFRESLLALAAAARIALNGFNEERRFTLGALLRAFTLGSVAERQNAGQLEFHDLLVFARRLVAGHPRVRAELHRRYTRLLLDEFQDTDPIQLELAVRITADPTIAASDWRRIQPLPGRLCVVGDPKQSIYRFRRADIGQFLRARDQIGASTATLSANFRSTPAVIDWVNHTMAELIRADPDVQPAYQPLDACRPGAGTHGSVTVLGSEAHPDSPTADELRRREAVDVAGAAVQALVEGWPVQEASGHGLGAVLRPCRPGDIAILVPSRTSLPALQDALAARGLSFRAENSSLVYAAPEVRALMLALRAADDPTDELAVVSTLRSQLYGCSDRHLYDWRVVHGQTFGWRADVSDDLVGHPVEVGLRSLGRLSTSIPTSTPAELLSTLVDERAVYELALAEPQHSRDVWRRIRFVVDQARAWSEAGGHGVRR